MGLPCSTRACPRRYERYISCQVTRSFTSRPRCATLQDVLGIAYLPRFNINVVDDEPGLLLARTGGCGRVEVFPLQAQAAAAEGTAPAGAAYEGTAKASRYAKGQLYLKFRVVPRPDAASLPTAPKPSDSPYPGPDPAEIAPLNPAKQKKAAATAAGASGAGTAGAGEHTAPAAAAAAKTAPAPAPAPASSAAGFSSFLSAAVASVASVVESGVTTVASAVESGIETALVTSKDAMETAAGALANVINGDPVTPPPSAGPSSAAAAAAAASGAGMDAETPGAGAQQTVTPWDVEAGD